MRFLLLITVLIFSFGLKGQEIDSIDIDSLEFKLEIIVVNNERKEPIKDAEVKIIGTDGSSKVFVTNRNGEIPTFYLQYNTSYSIVINKESYMLSKGKESTVGKNKSMVFFHKYIMQPMIICRIILHEQYYRHNEITPYKSGNIEDTTYQKIPASFYADIMTDNPLIIVQITGYQDESEEEGISKERADIFVKELIKLGINEDRLIMVDGGIKVYKKYNHRKEEVSKQENRMINFKVLSTDFEAK